MNQPRRVENLQTDKGKVPVYATGIVEQPWDDYSAADHDVANPDSDHDVSGTDHNVTGTDLPADLPDADAHAHADGDIRDSHPDDDLAGTGDHLASADHHVTCTHADIDVLREPDADRDPVGRRDADATGTGDDGHPRPLRGTPDSRRRWRRPR